MVSRGQWVDQRTAIAVFPAWYDAKITQPEVKARAAD